MRSVSAIDLTDRPAIHVQGDLVFTVAWFRSPLRAVGSSFTGYETRGGGGALCWPASRLL